MLFIFSTPVLIRHLWQLKTVVFLYLCLIHTVLFQIFKNSSNFVVYANQGVFNKDPTSREDGEYTTREY